MRCAVLTVLGALAGAALAQAPAAGEYATVAGILAERCVVCHRGDAAPLGLRLDSHENALKGSQRGPVIKRGDPAASELVRRVRGLSTPRMPLTGPPWLGEQEIAAIERWIAAGAPPPPASAVPPEKGPPPRRASDPVTYAEVAPILVGRCAKCHTDNGLMGPAPEAYRLVTYESTLAAGDRARVVPGNPGASELLRRVRGLSLPRMPFDGPPYLSGEETRLLERWIAQGARDASGRQARVPVGAKVRLRGVLSGPAQLDGMDLDLAGARIERRPAIGGPAEVRAIVREDGSLRVTRLRGR